MWTQDGTYPYLYSYINEHWIYLDLATQADKRFYDFSLEAWKLLSEQNLDVQLHEVSQKSSYVSTPQNDEKQAVDVIVNSNIPVDEARARISEIILFGL